MRRFFLTTALHLLWWDVVLQQPVLCRFRKPPLLRWQAIAHRYRLLAVDVGGILLKFGQFLSVRVDMLPAEVTDELSSMQDALSPEPLDAIVAQIEEEFACPIDQLFAEFADQPLGSASLAQVHRARLWSGEEVAVKVLRPGIRALIAADLQALQQAVRWLKYSPRIQKEYDLDGLIQEFSLGTHRELDLEVEGRSIERFSRQFADDPQVYIPHVFWDYTLPQTLTMEHVGYIKVTDLAALKAAGIERSEVASKLYNLYMHQFFVTNFVHADPHPGNIFVKPLPHRGEAARGICEFRPDDPVPYHPQRSFQIVLVDFGMVTTVPHRLRDGLREYVIGVGTHDAQRVVEAYMMGGLLSPNVHLDRLMDAHQATFNRLGEGYFLGHLNQVQPEEASTMIREYRDLVYASPIQIPPDMIFVFRAMGVLAGVTTSLDPDFDVGAAIRPFVEDLLREDWCSNWFVWMREAGNPVTVGKVMANIMRRFGHTIEGFSQELQ